MMRRVVRWQYNTTRLVRNSRTHTDHPHHTTHAPLTHKLTKSRRGTETHTSPRRTRAALSLVGAELILVRHEGALLRGLHRPEVVREADLAAFRARLLHLLAEELPQLRLHAALAVARVEEVHRLVHADAAVLVLVVDHELHEVVEARGLQAGAVRNVADEHELELVPVHHAIEVLVHLPDDVLDGLLVHRPPQLLHGVREVDGLDLAVRVALQRLQLRHEVPALVIEEVVLLPVPPVVSAPAGRAVVHRALLPVDLVELRLQQRLLVEVAQRVVHPPELPLLLDGEVVAGFIVPNGPRHRRHG
mmetsp:Transcript_37737/g.118145  ORF Transcript_37737/g.118145 Transcript_37737/m.118145 type:complete len:304 (-) Transcript_37737:288-1199(-)